MAGEGVLCAVGDLEDAVASLTGQSRASNLRSGKKMPENSPGARRGGSQLKVVAFIDPPQDEVIEKILRHCGLWRASAPRAPPDVEGLVHDLDGRFSVTVNFQSNSGADSGRI